MLKQNTVAKLIFILIQLVNMTDWVKIYKSGEG